MSASDFRLKTAERYRQIDQEGRPRPIRAARRAVLWTGFGVRRAVDAAARFAERATTRPPAAVSNDVLLVVGHRGAPYCSVENTIDSCERAIEREGANALEIDLCMTKDGEVVLWHDWDPNDTVAIARQLGIEPGVKYSPVAPDLWSSWRRHVDELTLAELREHYAYASKFLFFFKRRQRAHIPTFTEFVEWANTKPSLRTVFLDIKLPADKAALTGPMMDKIRATLAAAPPTFENVVMTPHPAVLDAMRDCTGDLPLCLDTEIPPGIVREPDQYSAVRRANESGSRVAAIGRPVLTLGGWRVYQELVANDLQRIANDDSARPMRLLSWTFDNRGEGKRMLQLGVQGILTNRPLRMRRIAKRLDRRLA